jgi:hypothetical protein
MRLASREEASLPPHYLAPDAVGAQPLEGDAQKPMADLGAEAHAPHGRMQAPADFHGVGVLQDEETIADRLARELLLGGDVEGVAPVVTLAGNGPRHEGTHIMRRGEAGRDVALIAFLGHVIAERGRVPKLDLAQHQRLRLDGG